MSLIGVLFCEFDNIKGQKITHQSPDNFMSPVAFDEIANFIIPKSELTGRVSQLSTSTMNILYMCKEVMGEHYPRHKYIFSLAFCFAHLPTGESNNNNNKTKSGGKGEEDKNNNNNNNNSNDNNNNNNISS
eukprot:PhM_4_TR4636/c0_g1_i1/m.99762